MRVVSAVVIGSLIAAAIVAGVGFARAAEGASAGGDAAAGQGSSADDRAARRPQVGITVPEGRIVLELYPDVAPHHVERFLELVDSGFYEETTFHRVIPGFLIQGGDPNTRNEDPDDDGHGGLENRRLDLELSDRGFKRGSLGMARDYRLDGASCQFFITLGRSAHLDGSHTLFGRVIRGIEIADRLAAAPADPQGRPEEPRAMSAQVIEIKDHRRAGPDPVRD